MISPGQPVFIGSDRYREAAFGRNHPLAIARVECVYDLCAMLNWFPDEAFIQSPVASRDELLRFHHPAYVDVLREVSSSGSVSPEQRERYHIGTMENPVFPGLFERACTSVGGSIQAARCAAEGRVAYHPSGGTHHGRPDRASGFCYFNDPVFSILTLLDLRKTAVVYVDLDAHHGDGVQDAFADDERVWTISVHEDGRWPYTGRYDDHGGGRSLNLPVPAGFHDAELQFLMHERILPFVRSASPEAIVITMGADALEGDPLSRLALSNGALCEAVMALISACPAAVVLGGGGYNPWTLARCWTAVWGQITGQTMPDALPEAAQTMLGNLACDLVDEEDVLPEWTTTLLDPPNKAAVRDSIRALA